MRASASSSRRGQPTTHQSQHRRPSRDFTDDEAPSFSSHQHPADWSIPGDAQEQERRDLEKDVLSRIGALDYTFENTDTQHSRGTSALEVEHNGAEYEDEEEEDASGGEGDVTHRPTAPASRRRGEVDDSSIEYGRHDGRSPRIGGGDLSLSFARHAGAAPAGFDNTEDFEYTDHSHTHTQSHSMIRNKPSAQHQSTQRRYAHAYNGTMREDGDESLLRAGDTLSTAQHHASAITLGAGLGGMGGPFNSRTPSRVNISTREFEFDPERKLPDLLAAATGRADGNNFSSRRAPASGKKGHGNGHGSLSMLLGNEEEESEHENNATFAHRGARSTAATHGSRSVKDKVRTCYVAFCIFSKV